MHPIARVSLCLALTVGWPAVGDALARQVPIGSSGLVGERSLEPTWSTDFALAGADWSVHALAWFDDGSGPALYAGGGFLTIGGVVADGIARWDGVRWEPVGSGLARTGSILALTVYDDGSGPALYAGGDFLSIDGLPATGLARYDASGWSAVPGGTPGARVRVLEVARDTGGVALFVGGSFFSMGGVSSTNLARYDGAWSAIPTSLSPASEVYAIQGVDTFDGPSVFVATSYLFNPIALYRWSAGNFVPQSMGPVGLVQTLEVFNDGTGERLYAGGMFGGLGNGQPASGLARWDGLAWESAGTIGGGAYAVDDFVVRSTVSGERLVAVGGFQQIDGQLVENVASYDGQAWSPLTGVESGAVGADGLVRSVLAVAQGGADETLYFGGDFLQAGGTFAARVVRFEDTWEALSGGSGLVGGVRVLEAGAPGSFYAAGDLEWAGGQAVGNVAGFEGGAWQELAGGTDGRVEALEYATLGPATGLFVGGSFSSVGTAPISASHVAFFDGTGWSALGTGLDGPVLALERFEDPASASGPWLFAGGWFGTAGGVTSSALARYDGSVWSAPAGETFVPQPPLVQVNVSALRSHDDGSGPALYVGGSFSGVTGLAAEALLRWRPSGYEALPGGGVAPSGATVDWITTGYLPEFGREVLLVGGDFTSIGGVSAERLAIWDGTTWHARGLGVAALSGVPLAAAVFDATGRGRELFASVPSGGARPVFQRWDGGAWVELSGPYARGPWNSGIGQVLSLLPVSDPRGAHLVLGGSFALIGDGVPSSGIGRWTSPRLRAIAR